MEKKSILGMLLLTLIFTLILTPQISAEEPSEQWVARYNGIGNYGDQAYDIALDASGNVYVAGHSYTTGTNQDYATIKYDKNGNQLWVATYDGPGNLKDFIESMAVDASGNVYVTGRSHSSTSKDYATIKYDTNGIQLWTARYNGTGNSTDGAVAISLDDFDNIYVTGYSFGVETLFDCVTIKYDTDGNQLWEARYNGPGNHYDYSSALAVDASGNVYVAGYTRYPDDINYLTIKYDTNGNQLWVAEYNGTGNGTDSVNSIALDASGNVYITGTSTGSTNWDSDYATIKYDRNGNQLWVARYDGTGNSVDRTYAIDIDTLGNVYVTGSSYGIESQQDYATIMYDTDGNQLWVARYNGLGNSGDRAYAMSVDALGNVYVAGRSYTTEINEDYATIKYDANGNQLWVATYDGPGDSTDYVHAITLDGSDNVYVTGRSGPDRVDCDIATIKYSVSEPPLTVEIDIKPGSYPNSINLKSRGNVPVAILTNNNFDAYNVDPDTVNFAGANPLRWTMKDVDADVDIDLLFHFKTQELELTNESTEATLEGETYDEIMILGADSVNMVPKGKAHIK